MKRHAEEKLQDEVLEPDVLVNDGSYWTWKQKFAGMYDHNDTAWLWFIIIID